MVDVQLCKQHFPLLELPGSQGVDPAVGLGGGKALGVMEVQTGSVKSLQQQYLRY